MGGQVEYLLAPGSPEPRSLPDGGLQEQHTKHKRDVVFTTCLWVL